MDEDFKKQQLQDTEEVKNFHQTRRAFLCISDMLLIAPLNVEWSHLEWLLNMGFSELDADKIIVENCRGYFLNNELHFYTGYNFDSSLDTEKQFFKTLPELVARLNLNKQVKIFGGKIKGRGGES